MSSSLPVRPSDGDPDGTTRDVVHVEATRRVREAADIAQPPTAPGAGRLLQKLGIGPEARSDREIRDSMAATRVQAIRKRNQILLEMQEAIDAKNLEKFKSRLAMMANAELRAGWSIEAGAILNALEDLAHQIDRAQQRVAQLQSEDVRRALRDDITVVYTRLRAKHQELLPAEAPR